MCRLQAHHNVPKIRELAYEPARLAAKGNSSSCVTCWGTGNEVNAEELEEGKRPLRVHWRAHPAAATMWVVDFRQHLDDAALDVVPPAATGTRKTIPSSTTCTLMHCSTRPHGTQLWEACAPTSRCSRPCLPVGPHGPRPPGHPDVVVSLLGHVTSRMPCTMADGVVLSRRGRRHTG